MVQQPVPLAPLHEPGDQVEDEVLVDVPIHFEIRNRKFGLSGTEMAFKAAEICAIFRP